jgi:hypothetical protein
MTTKRQPNLTDAEKAEIVRMKENGRPAAIIAKKLCRSLNAVQSAYFRFKAERDGNLAKKKTTARPCLCCRRDFESSGPGNRLCANCSTKSVSPYAI